MFYELIYYLVIPKSKRLMENVIYFENNLFFFSKRAKFSKFINNFVEITNYSCMRLRSSLFLIIILAYTGQDCAALKQSSNFDYTKALTYKAQFKIDSAEYYFNISYKQAVDKKDNLLAMNSLLLLADMYYDFGVRSLVLQQLDKVKSLAQKHKLLQTEEYAHYCDLMGKIYLDANAPDFALEIWQQSQKIREQLYPTHDIRLIRSYVNFLTYYYTLFDVKNTLKYLDNVTFLLSTNNHSLHLIDIPHVYNVLARSIKMIADPENRHHEYYRKSRRYLSEGISQITHTLPINYNKLGQLYHTLANTYVDEINFYIKNNNHGMMISSLQKATVFYDLAIENYKRVFRQKHENIARSYFVKGLMFQYAHLSDTISMQWFRKAIEMALPISNKTDIVFSRSSKGDLLQSIRFHEKSLWNVYLKTGNLQYLHEGNYYTKKRVLIWEKMMYEFQSENKNEILNTYEINPLQYAAMFSYELYRNTNDRKYIESIFQLSEKSKYYTLLKNLQQGTASDSVFQNSNLIRNYHQLIKQRDLLQDRQMIHYYSHRDDIVDKQKDSLKFLDIALNNFDVFLQNRYTEYFSAFNRLKMYDLKSVQKMLPNNKTAIIEYFVLETDLDRKTLAITITQDTCFISLIPLNVDEIINHGNDFQKYIQNSDFDNYKNEAFYLYQTMVAPSLKPLKEIDKIIFIPDGSMFNISFDALITKMPTNTNKDYRNLDFLAKTHEISLQLSANMMGFLKNKKMGEKSTNALFISPKFSSKGFSNLPFSEECVTKLSNKFQSDVFQQHQASKQNFLKSAARSYSVIHFATHSAINCKNPLESKLYFSQFNPSDTSNSLTLSDVYKHKINTEMVVLNACESNLGFNETGEGIINFPRAFLMSGSKSVVSTLWKTDDQTSSEIILSFYEELNKGLEKDEALRNAKLKYLNNAKSSDDANPVYWAGMVVFGDNSPIHLETKNSNIKWYFIIAALTILAGGFLIMRKRKKRL